MEAGGGPAGRRPERRRVGRQAEGLLRQRSLPAWAETTWLRSAGLERGPEGETPKPIVNDWWLIPHWLMRHARVPFVFRDERARRFLTDLKLCPCYAGRVKGNPVHRRGSRRSGPPVDPVAALIAYAVKLHDNGDGHGVDWAKVAETGFRAAFTCLDNAKGDARALNVVRRVHDGAYTRLAGSPDSATPYSDDRPKAPPLMPDAGLNPDLELNR